MVNMKNRMFTGLATAVFGVLVALGPQYIFKVCENMNDEIPVCHWTGLAEIGIGGVVAALGIVYLLAADERIRAGLGVAAALNGILAFLVPHVLIGVCAKPHMHCRLSTLPSLSIISVALVILAVANVVYLLQISKGRGARSADA